MIANAGRSFIAHLACHGATKSRMAFKPVQNKVVASSDAESLFRDLRNRKVAGLLSHQADIIRAYHKVPATETDVALQLPTGSGKTLVGLLIAEWQRRTLNRRVVFLCPTRQLVHQVVQQSTQQYGIDALPFVGRQADYSPASRAAYTSGSTLAVTTYNGLFNANSFFDNAGLAVFDDAHSAENYVASHWSLVVRRVPHRTFFNALAGVLLPLLSPQDQLRLTGESEEPLDASWVDKVPFERILPRVSTLTALIDTHATEKPSKYVWRLLRDHLEQCCVFISTTQILIRPLLPPTWSYAPFANLKQRVYMSATLGEGANWSASGVFRESLACRCPRDGTDRALAVDSFCFPR